MEGKYIRKRKVSKIKISLETEEETKLLENMLLGRKVSIELSPELVERICSIVSKNFVKSLSDDYTIIKAKGKKFICEVRLVPEFFNDD